MGNTAISIYIDSIAAHNAGYDVGRWVSLPVSDKELERIMDEVQRDGAKAVGYPAEELEIVDKEVLSEFADGDYIGEAIDGWCDIEEVNLLARALSALSDGEAEALNAWAAANDGQLGIRELLAAAVQADDIPYYQYGQPDHLSNEAAFGYHLIEDLYPEIGEMLAEATVYDTPISCAFDAEVLGENVEMNGYVKLFDNGYIDVTQPGPDENIYSWSELKDGIDEMYERSLRKSASELKSSVGLPDAAYAMYEQLAWQASHDQLPRWSDDEAWRVARESVSVYTGDQEAFYEDNPALATRAEALGLFDGERGFFEANPDADIDDYKAYAGAAAMELANYEEIREHEEAICEKVAWAYAEAIGFGVLDPEMVGKVEGEIATWNRFAELETLTAEIGGMKAEADARADPEKFVEWQMDHDGFDPDVFTFELEPDTSNPELETLRVGTLAGTVEFDGLHVGSAFGTPEHTSCNVFAVNGDEYIEIGTLDFDVYGNTTEAMPGTQDKFLDALGEFMLDHREEYCRARNPRASTEAPGTSGAPSVQIAPRKAIRDMPTVAADASAVKGIRPTNAARKSAPEQGKTK